MMPIIDTLLAGLIVALLAVLIVALLAILLGLTWATYG